MGKNNRQTKHAFPSKTKILFQDKHDKIFLYLFNANEISTTTVP